MRNKKSLYALVAILFYLILWESFARALALPFAIPTIEETAAALFSLAVTQGFWSAIASSLLRILAGLAIGVILGTLLAVLTVLNPLASAIISPAQKIIRCTPVASFIMILWVLLGRDAVPGAIAVLMVSPIIWQNLKDGYAALDPSLDEVLTVFRSSATKRLRILVIPGLKRPFLTGLANAAGFAWKAGIAAQIIAYTSGSIGREISDARNLFNGAQMMAWTICVIILSLIIEKLIHLLIAFSEREA